MPSRPSTLATVTTLPRSPSIGSWPIIWVITCLAVRNVPLRFTPRTWSQLAPSTRCTGPPPDTPALVTTPSMRPVSSVAAATNAWTEPSSVTSQISKRSGAVTPAAAGPRSPPTTRAPSAVKRSTHAAPIPDDEPVTSMTLPSKRPMTTPPPEPRRVRDGGES